MKPAYVAIVTPTALTTILVPPRSPLPLALPEDNDSVKAIRALEEQLRTFLPKETTP